MRRLFQGVLPLAVAALAACGPSSARGETADRLDISLSVSRNVQRLHSIAADTLGLSYEMAWSPEVRVDLRAIDLPMGKTGSKPALHLAAAAALDRQVLAPPLEGMTTAAFPVIDLRGALYFDLPLDAFLKGNAGVGLRIGWEGGDMLTRTASQSFLENSRARFDFVRTSGALEGSTIGFGMGRDERFGWDAATHRWDVRVALQGRICGGPSVAAPAPAPAKAGAKAPPAAKPLPGPRLLWIWADADVDTDGGPGADGLRARAGLGVDLNTLVTAIFTPLRN